MVVAITSIFTLLLMFYILLRSRDAHVWFISYVFRNKKKHHGLKHIMFCFVDHYEPMWKGADAKTQYNRVKEWRVRYPEMVNIHYDSDGRKPCHTFFYPEEEYKKEYLDLIQEICDMNIGEIEIHLHHDNDTAEGLREKLNRFKKTLHDNHNALVTEKDVIKWAFIHGNWALDNSLKSGRQCGVNNELLVLRETGCYADFTFPAPCEAQPATINNIFYAKGIPNKSKSYDQGVLVEVNKAATGDLMIIQGPLLWNWKNRKFGIIPRIENSDIRISNPPTKQRVDLWVEANIHVKGKPDWIFIKIHTHGAQETDMETLLGDDMSSMHSYLEEKYNDGEEYLLHYVSARELYNIVKAAEAGETGNPNQYRDYKLKRKTII